MLWNIPDEKPGHIPYEKFNECCKLAESFLYPFNAAAFMMQGSLLLHKSHSQQRVAELSGHLEQQERRWRNKAVQRGALRWEREPTLAASINGVRLAFLGSHQAFLWPSWVSWIRLC
jgi:hypothetical protein